MAPANGPLATPTQASFSRIRSESKDALEKSPARAGEALAVPPGKIDARSLSSNSIFGARSVANTIAPGSFSSNLKSTNGARSLNPGGLRIDFGSSYVNRDHETMSAGPFGTEQEASEKRQMEFREAINKEMKIKTGSENLLEALMTKSNAKQTKDQRQKVESELSSSNRKIAELRGRLQDEIERWKVSASMPRPGTPSMQTRPSFMSNREVLTADDGRESVDDDQDLMEYEEDDDGDEESPSFVLGEILETLERDGMQPDYYVSRANALVELLQRHPTLKYDLAWSIFGLRVQTMLLSESRDVVAAGYRLTRHAMGDRRSLQTIRDLQTDSLVVLSLAKDDKARIEREQALKFVRAFVDVKDGVRELSNAVIRAVISVAEHYEDRLRNMALLTLSEILVRDPHLLVATGGVLPLAEALKDGHYAGGDALVASFMYLSDTPELRKLLFVSQELEGPFSLFTDNLNAHASEERLRSGLKSIAGLLNSWQGLFTLSQTGFSSISSLLLSLQHPSPLAQDLILDLLFDIFHITPPSWTSSFLAGRRLTTYGRVRALPEQVADAAKEAVADDAVERLSLLEHWTSLLLEIFLQCGLIPTVTMLVEEAEEQSIERKATILLAEVQKLADRILPPNMSRPIQPLSAVMRLPKDSLILDDEYGLQNMVYQLDSVSKTMTRTAPVARSRGNSTNSQQTVAPPSVQQPTTKYPADMNEVDFRELLVASQVLNHVNLLKWRWDIIHDIIAGPLTNRKLFSMAANDSKWLKRMFNCYRPFKYRFCEIRNTKPNQRYVRTGCLLIKSLLKFPEGVQYLLENKLFRQLAECLAQLDPASNITSAQPMFSVERVRDTLTGGYFQILGALTGDQHGLAIISRWRMLNMFYHIVDLYDRQDLITSLLAGLDFTLDSHLRIILSKALTACERPVRIFATRILRKYATQTQQSGDGTSRTSPVAYWALRLLITQLYDPSVDVSEVAVQILQEACDRVEYLEFVVRCRPALDHLGEIGAPLLLRFLSSSNGYKYLSGLDYITQEMDDWFLGRNEKYVAVVEASLSRALAYENDPSKRQRSASLTAMDDEAGLITATGAASVVPLDRLGDVPPHFYRELVRTPDGCRLLQESGHFEAFTRHIRNAADAATNVHRHKMSDSKANISEPQAQAKAATDPESILRVKSCLWAIGNVGSMELGAHFIETTSVVEHVIVLARKSPVVTLRGTAFFVLGLISRSWHGMEILAEHGWDAATDQLGRSLGYVLPPELTVLFSLREEQLPGRSMLPPLANLTQLKRVSASDEWESKVYAAVVEAGNTVLQRRALGELAEIRKRRPDLFKSTSVLRNVMFVFECHTIKLPVRQRVFDMFDKEVMRRRVLEDSEESSGSSSEGGDNGVELDKEPPQQQPQHARKRSQTGGFSKKEVDGAKLERGGVAERGEQRRPRFQSA